MKQHYTRSTVSASAWCSKCRRHTQHRVDDRLIGPCLVCIDRLEQEHKSAPAPAAQQQALFKESA